MYYGETPEAHCGRGQPALRGPTSLPPSPDSLPQGHSRGEGLGRPGSRADGSWRQHWGHGGQDVWAVGRPRDVRAWPRSSFMVWGTFSTSCVLSVCPDRSCPHWRPGGRVQGRPRWVRSPSHLQDGRPGALRPPRSMPVPQRHRARAPRTLGASARGSSLFPNGELGPSELSRVPGEGLPVPPSPAPLPLAFAHAASPPACPPSLLCGS